MLKGNSLRPGVEDDIISGKKKFLILEDFVDSYIKRFNEFRAFLCEKLKPQYFVSGKPLTGVSTADLFPNIVRSINDGGQLHIPDIWEQAENEAVNKASTQFREDFKEKCDEKNNGSQFFTTGKLDEVRYLIIPTLTPQILMQNHFRTSRILATILSTIYENP
jgi:hypothetical protein